MSFLAWTLTVLAPCVFPILPVIVWWSVVNGKKSNPRIIIASFSVSILIFTLILQWLVSQFGISQQLLTKISAVILILFGVLLLFPALRQKLMHLINMDERINKASSSQKSGPRWDIILWATLGPIFNTCSPTYAILIATVLPASFMRWLVNILAYIAGLALILWLIAVCGRRLVNKMKRASSPNGWFKKAIAIILIFMWLAIFMKRDKALEVWFIENGLVIDTTDREYDQVKDIK